MRRLIAALALFPVVAVALGACTPLDNANDVFRARGSAAKAGSGGATGGMTAVVTPMSSDSGAAAGGAGDGGQGIASGGRGEGAGGAASPTARADAGPADAGCFDPHGFQGNGCYVCPATDVVGLENTCSGAACTSFDNGVRLSKLTQSGDLPPLPAPSDSGGAGGSLSVGGAGGGGASNHVACDSLSGKGQVVYVTGSSAAKPFLQQIAQQIAAQNAFIVYTSTGSCVGVDAVLNGTPMTTGPAPAPASSATYWDSSSSTGVACDLPAGGVAADLGISDVFAQSCAGFELTSLDALAVRDAHGAIQTMTFVVPANSRFSEISAQAAYFVFGFGAGGGVLDGPRGSPVWNDESQLYQRSATSGTQTMIAAAIGVPSALWKGTPHPTSDDIAAAIQSAGLSKDTADKALGILAADYIDSRNLRAQIRMLAFQDTSQRCAVFPDSTATSHDKQNVRDGHYPIWSPLHLLYKVDQLGNPVNPASGRTLLDIVGYLSGTKELPNGVQLIDVYAQSGLVPECAMRVTRTKDGGDIVPHQPAAPCACLFEAKATGVTSCKVCRVQGECGQGETCSQGYCEG